MSFTLPANVQELVLFGSANVTGNGNSLDNTITANSGNDVLFGGGGNDTFIPGPGQSTVDGGRGINVIKLSGLRSDYRTTGLADGGISDCRSAQWHAPDGTSTITGCPGLSVQHM